MVKKLQKMAAKKKSQEDSSLGGVLPAGLLDGALAQGLKDSARQIWAAGLGAFAKSQGEGGKLFDTLVKEGLNLQQKTRSKAEDKLGAVASKMSGMADDVSNRAGQHWDKLESIFEERVARALNRLGVPSSKDIDALIERIDRLSAAVGLETPSPKANKTAKAKPAAKAAPKAAAQANSKPSSKATSKAPAKSATKPVPQPAGKAKATTKATPAPARKASAKLDGKVTKAVASPFAAKKAAKTVGTPAARTAAKVVNTAKPAAPQPARKAARKAAPAQAAANSAPVAEAAAS